MIYIHNLVGVGDDVYTINAVHYAPLDKIDGLGKTKDQLLEKGFLVNELPAPEDIPKKVAVLKYNVKTDVLFYDYVDALADPNDFNEKLKSIDELNAELLFDSMTKDARIEVLEQQQADLTFELISEGIL